MAYIRVGRGELRSIVIHAVSIPVRRFNLIINLRYAVYRWTSPDKRLWYLTFETDTDIALNIIRQCVTKGQRAALTRWLNGN